MKLVGNVCTALGFTLAITILGGCATPNDLRRSNPALALNSAKSAKNVAMCITDKWENAGSGALPINMRETENGFSVIYAVDGTLYDLVDVSNSPDGGSYTKFYSGIVAVDKFKRPVIECQTGH